MEDNAEGLEGAANAGGLHDFIERYQAYVMELDLKEIEEAQARHGSWAKSSVYLEGQTFQMYMLSPAVQAMLGCASLLLLIMFFVLRRASEDNVSMKNTFIKGILHFHWTSPTYPKLKYTGKQWNGFSLYKLVPCAWLSIVC